MGKFDDLFPRRNRGVQPQGQPQKKNDYEFYEDTHNSRGEYIKKGGLRQEEIKSPFNFSQTSEMQSHQTTQIPTQADFVSPRLYQNVVVYEPKNPDDVQHLIDYLKRREPAIVNLDNVDMDAAQRILDFISGAAYALSGSVHRIASNIFLISPEGVEITVPYEDR
ncbi:MAG: cell division protein SepF [Firmicutes bacterium]|nr:cell division protein SepF [Bacillota bacterium]MCL2256281.1 cell division protein SepF [Bacillota bacterium]